MTKILTPENLTLEAPGAATNRSFFNEREWRRPNETFEFARSFSCSYEDLLPEGVGMVLLAGEDADGELVGINDAEKEICVSLYFDAREGPATYGWQLTEAGADGREVYQLRSGRESYEVSHFSFDVQGRLQKEQTYAGDDQAAMEIATKVRELASHDRLRQGAETLRRNRDRMEAELTQFSVEGLTRMTRELHVKQLEKKQKLIDHIGFTALKPLAR
jgi:hypothetical protein